MAAPTNAVRIKPLDSVVVLYPTTDLVGDAVCDELGEAVDQALAGSYRGIVVNLGEVHQINSTGMGVLVACAVRANRAGLKMAFCSALPRVERHFETIHVLALMSHPSLHRSARFETEAEAVQFCSPR
jgi:anti-anti-sigma factor